MKIAWWAARARGGDPGRIAPGFLKVFAILVAPIIRLAHRPTITGAEHLRSGGPALIVANHSGGFALSEILSLVTLYLGPLRGLRVAALAHPFAFHLWPLPMIMRALGTVPATYEAAQAALADGASVLVFPGGDYEASRPFWQADVVDFNRRKGFLKIARAAGVPIIPLGVTNSHWSVPTLWRSTFVLPWLFVLPRLFDIKRFPLTLLSVLGAAAILFFVPTRYGWAIAIGLTWLWMSSPFTLFPIVPVTVRFTIGQPIANEVLFANDDLDAAYDHVVGEVQRLVRS